MKTNEEKQDFCRCNAPHPESGTKQVAIWDKISNFLKFSDKKTKNYNDYEEGKVVVFDDKKR